MSNDARISTALPSHPKTKKLIRRTGSDGGLCLVWLFLWAANNRPDGDLSGLTDEDIELAVDWTGKEGAFVQALVDVRFLDVVDGGYLIHDWEEHNPWAAGSEARSLKAKWNAIKRHHGEEAADKQVPEYAAFRKQSASNQQAEPKQTAQESDATSNASSNASSTNTVMHDLESSNAPIRILSESLPSPSPSPSPNEETTSGEVVIGDDSGESTPPQRKPKSITATDLIQSLEGLSLSVASDYIQFRKQKKAPLNATAWKAICREVVKTKATPDEAIAEAMAAGWTGFKAEWYENRIKQNIPHRQGVTIDAGSGKPDSGSNWMPPELRAAQGGSR